MGGYLVIYVRHRYLYERQKRILVVGDLMLDRFSCGSVARISPEAPAAVINLDRSKKPCFVPDEFATRFSDPFS